MSLPPSTANWHWKNKNVTPWAKAWFERELTTLVVTGEGEESISISSVFDVEGDVELGQRKSKLITIYDCKLIVDWVGIGSDGTEHKGRVHIPEVSHEITLDGLSDYTYMWELMPAPASLTPVQSSLLALAKKKLPAVLEGKFTQFPKDLIDTHGRDLTVGSTPNSTDPSRTGTPTPVAVPSLATKEEEPLKPAVKAPAVEKKSLNTSTITAEASFMASAEDLFDLLTNEKKIPSWTRASAQSQAKPSTAYSLFSGGVTGTYISLTKPSSIIQSWKLTSPTWPADHDSTLTTTLEQGSESTKVTFKLDGVPKGMEDELKRNLEGYYIHGFKSIGLGSVL